MVMAIKVLDVGLREDFGFKHLLWIYSGRQYFNSNNVGIRLGKKRVVMVL